MKNLFKKLAFVLALAFTISVAAPAASASAAAAPAYKKVGKILYVGGDVSGTIPATYRFYFNNAAGYTATWKTSNSKVAKIDAKSGVITAVAPGKATITATLTNKAGKKCVLTNAVWVKQNADKVEFGSKAKIENGLKVGEKAKINVARMLGDRKVWSQSDFSLITDAIVWTTSDASVATVDKWGTVTAKKAGEVTITASATQSNGNLVSAKNSYTLVVTDGLMSATQKDLDSVELKFASAVTKDTVNADTVKLFKMVGNTKVAVLVKAVTVDSKDATKVAVDTFGSLEKNATYVVEFDGKAFEFKAVDPAYTSVADIVVNTTEIEGTKAGEIEFDLVTSEGVVITSDELLNRVTVETKNTNVWLNGKEVTFFALNQEATFTATFHTYTYDTNGVEKTIKKDFVLRSVAEKVENVSRLDWTFTTIGGSDNFDFINVNDINKTLTVSEAEEGVKLVVQYQKDNTAKDKITTEGDTSYKFESSNTNVVIANGHNLYPVTAGTATILIKKDDKVIDSIQITVSPKRVATVLNVKPSKNYISKNNTEDSVEVKFEVKDQYGKDFTDTKSVLTVTNIVAPSKVVFGTITVDNLKTTLVGTRFTEAGTYQFEVKYGTLTRVFNVVANNTSGVEKQQLVVTENTIDTTVDLSLITGQENTGYTSEISIINVDKNNNFVSNNKDNTFLTKAEAVEALKTAADDTTYYYIEVVDSKNNVATSGGAIGLVKNVITEGKDGAFVFNAIAKDESNNAVKVPAGQYKINAYALTKGETTPDAIGVSFITVKDTEPSYSVTQKESDYKVTDLKDLFGKDKAIDVKLDGVSITSEDIVTVDHVGNVSANNSVFIKTIKVSKEVVLTLGEKPETVSMTFELTINKHMNITN